jgi:lysophospholipase L1-like esterase
MSDEVPPSPEIMRLVEGMLGDGPFDLSLLAGATDPAQAEARQKAAAALREADWANLGRYEARNAEIVASGPRPEVVFMGDSITEMWPLADPGLFGPAHVGRGISGQTSPQMLARFWPDVIALKPGAVHLLCGTNDVAGNTGPTTPERYKATVSAMAALAEASGIRIILGAVPPAGAMLWQPGFDPKPWIAELNDWLRALASERSFALVDYHTALSDGAGAMRRDFSHDGVHPNRRGYAAMCDVLAPVLRTG